MGAMSMYNAPAYGAREDLLIGWAMEAAQEADAWLKTQRAAKDWDQAIDLIAGLDMATDLDDPSSPVKVNLTKRIAREMVATVSNIRFASTYRTDNNKFDDNAHVLNTISTLWYVNTFADRRLKEGYQYAAAMGTGYISPVWDPNFHAKGRGDIKLDVYGPRDVLPIQMPRDHDLQRCYAVGLKNEMPINLARATYPKFAGDLVPDRDAQSYLSKGVAAVQKFISPALRIGNTSREKERDSGFPTVDILAFYIDDGAINLTDHVVPMGKPGSSWYYEVPYVGMNIPTVYNNSGGQTLYRVATEEDCRLFPMRRLLICSKTACLYDNTSYWWHGKVPLVRLTFDRWAWEGLGYGVGRDSAPIERSNNRLLRAVDDSMNVRLSPPIQYDENVVSRGLMETINLRAPGEEIAMNMSMGEPIKPILPADYYNWPPQILEHIAKMQEVGLWQAGVKDMTALAKAKQLPSGDSLEKMLELIGPLATDNARSVEEAVAQLGALNLPLFFQFYSTKRRIQMGGPTATVPVDFDYDPGNMIPSHMNGEDPEKGPSVVQQIERARLHHQNFYFWVNPKSMHQMTQLSRKLIAMQLMKVPGFPWDPWTIAKLFDFDDDFGPVPEGAHSGMEKWMAWKHIQREMAVEEAKALQAAGIQPGGQRGRPPSGQKAPHNQTKDGGARTTTSQS